MIFWQTLNDPKRPFPWPTFGSRVTPSRMARSNAVTSVPMSALPDRNVVGIPNPASATVNSTAGMCRRGKFVTWIRPPERDCAWLVTLSVSSLTDHSKARSCGRSNPSSAFSITSIIRLTASKFSVEFKNLIAATCAYP